VSELIFDEKVHAYYLDGERVPSVTNVISPLNDFGMIRPEVLQHAADRGTAIHRAIELYCGDPTLDDPLMAAISERLPDGLDEYEFYCEAKPYFAGFKKFIAEKQPKIVSSEQKVFHSELKYAGTMDLVTEMPELYFVDVKNTAALCKTAPIQLIAYQEARISMEPYDETHRYETFCRYRDAKRATLWLHKTGKYNLIVSDPNDYTADWELFKILLRRIHASVAAKKAAEHWKERMKSHG
jgi:hypothetical protein